MSSNSESKSFEYWEKYRGKIYSSKGGWVAGKDVYCHGYSILNELIGNISYMQMLILNATGRLVERKLADWFEANYICLSWPDSRIWCNQMGAYGGTLNSSVVAATASGLLASDSRIYGGTQNSVAGVKFIKSALISYKEGMSIEDIIEDSPKRNGRPMVMGYVRPANSHDERIAPMEKITKKLGFSVGEHLSLAYEISSYLNKNYGEGINIGGYTCAFAVDQNISGQELFCIRAMTVASGVTACYIDTSEKVPETYLPLHCEDIAYQGHPPRELE